MTGPTPQPSPFVLQPKLFEKVWGGRRLATLGKDMPDAASIGESWELADLDGTSASGAGGGGVSSTIARGPLAGKTIREAIELWGDDLLGNTPAPDGRFPLLVKYLDAREDLSIQVHPSPEYAKAHPEAHVKTECWYVVQAEPGARIMKGMIPGVTAKDVRAAAETGSGVPGLLHSAPAKIGDLHELPTGTIHALGAGTLVAEVQTPSDTTFRVYDWAKELGRVGRELHLDQAVECILDGPPPATSRLGAHDEAGRLCSLDAFTIDEARPEGGDEIPLSFDGRCQVLMLVSGVGEVYLEGEDDRALAVHAGHTIVVPAAVADRAVLACDPGAPLGGTTLLRVGVGAAR
ncbi:MAG: type I phosphomannose isomerase catalytic subunit [Phycisphaerales bacterium]